MCPKQHVAEGSDVAGLSHGFAQELAHSWENLGDRMRGEARWSSYPFRGANELMRIRFAPSVSGGALGDRSVGRGLVLRGESEECLEGGHRGATPVVAEDVFVEVDLEVLV